MTNPSQNAKMELDLKNVLLRTRGRNWGYSFVLRPQKPDIDSWYDVHVKVFEGRSLDSVPVNLGGILIDGIEKHVFVATAFADPVHRDDAGRPVANYIIWFPNVDLRSDSMLSVPNNWGSQVMTALQEACNKTFDMPISTKADDSSGDVEKVFENARDTLRPIMIEGAAATVKIDLVIPINGKTPTTSTSSSAKRVVVALLLLFGFFALLWFLNRKRE